jgi:hypothetical protein
MIKRNVIISILIIFTFLPVYSQVKKQDSGLKREVTLYNPYKPSLPEAKKRSFLPDMKDTSTVRPDFHYDVRTTPFFPEYTISPIKAAALLSDPLTKLYKSYIKLGIGNYLTPLAELSITNQRSKNGAIGFYARHFSTNGKVELDNGKKAFAGYMDNDASFFGRKFFRKNILGGSIDYSQKTRYAYGYSPAFSDYDPTKKEIRLPYNNIGGKVAFSSINLDSTEFSYNFGLSYDYFTAAEKLYQRKFTLTGEMSKEYNGFYVGSGLRLEHARIPDSLLATSKYIFALSPYVKKASDQWAFKLGLQLLLDRNMTSTAKAHIYPDINFSFNVVPSYMNFFVALNGYLDENEPMKVISDNPFLLTKGSLFTVPNTSHDLDISTGLRGNNGIGGNYILSVSYSLISNMLFYTNVVKPDTIHTPDRGNYFAPISDDVELLNVHGEISAAITDKLSVNASANIYKYTLSKFDYAWGKPDWDGKFGLKYNLRDKIIAGVDLSLQGKRKMIVNGQNMSLIPAPPAELKPVPFDMPSCFNLNLSAEYRYSKILSFWGKVNNISSKHYYEWVYYPSQSFLFMIGFTYSL